MKTSIALLQKPEILIGNEYLAFVLALLLEGIMRI
jgi:hypothetical protein